MRSIALIAVILTLSTANAQNSNEQPSPPRPVRLSIAVAGDYQLSPADSVDHAKHPNVCRPTRVLISLDRADTVILRLVDSRGNFLAEHPPRFLEPGYYELRCEILQRYPCPGPGSRGAGVLDIRDEPGRFFGYRH